MKYIVIEIQTATDGTVGNIVTAHETRSEAESKYHSVLAAAAVSAMPQHAAALLASDGTLIDSRCYEH
jgi:protein-L-isoaspartate O-methyltransferase